MDSIYTSGRSDHSFLGIILIGYINSEFKLHYNYVEMKTNYTTIYMLVSIEVK